MAIESLCGPLHCPGKNALLRDGTTWSQKMNIYLEK